MGSCAICNHPQRAEIETAILDLHCTPGSSLQDVATQFGLNLNDLKVHMIMHASLGNPEDTSTESLARKCKLREADTLERVTNEYMVTLKALGRRINHNLQTSEVMVEKLITKPITDMYIGLGGEIRATVKALAELDHHLNGPKDDSQGGLGALAAAITQSAQMAASGNFTRPSSDDE